MVNPQLLDYIKSVKKQGHSHENIKSHLKKHGYPQNIIDDAFNHPHLKEKKKSSKNKLVLYIAMTVLAIILFVLGLMLYKTLDTSIENTFNKDSNCENISLVIHEMNGEKVLCVFPDNSMFQVFLKNQGTQKINSVEIIISSENAETNDTPQVNLAPGDVLPYIKQHENGQISKVTITPIIVKEDKSFICSSIISTEIKTC